MKILVVPVVDLHEHAVVAIQRGGVVGNGNPQPADLGVGCLVGGEPRRHALQGLADDEQFGMLSVRPSLAGDIVAD